MSIEIKIHIPDDEIGAGKEALEKRMAVLGYAIPEAVFRSAVLHGTGAMRVTDEGAEPVASQAMTFGEAVRAEQAAEQPKEEPKKRGRKPKEDKPQITNNPENRIGPQDAPEVEAQDEADERAEVEASRDPEKPLTLDDFRAAAGLYITKFSMEAAQADGPTILEKALGKPPQGEAFWRMTLVEQAGQAALRKAVDAWVAAAQADKRFGGS